MTFKIGIIPKGNTATHLRVCEKCGMRCFYHGTAFPSKTEKCDGCKFLKERMKAKKGKKVFVKRNPRIIKRGK